MENKTGKILGALCALFIIAMLVASGPAQAFTLNIKVDKSKVSIGEKIVFNAGIDINSNERVKIDEIVLEIKGNENVSCRFNADGSIISGCKGILIKKLDSSTPSYGYNSGNYSGYGYNFGYGYGYETSLLYEITLYTDQYSIGSYATNLKLIAGDSKTEFLKSGPGFKINSKSSSSESSYSSNNINTGVCPISGWECAGWSRCNDGKETRICLPVSNCYIATMPEETRECVIQIQSGLRDNNYDAIAGTIALNGNSRNSGNDNNSNQNKNTSMSVNGIMANFLTGITGAVIVSAPKQSLVALWVAVIFVAFLVGVLIAMILVKSVRRARRIRRMRELNRIMYRPQTQ
ncbi:MAG: hypothetical protein AABX54_01850 [Nanoarchaeota archaeon]